MKQLFLLIFFPLLLLPLNASCEDTDSREYLLKGRRQLSEGQYNDAISSLSFAAEKFQLLGDYALLWLSEAYQKNGDHEKTLKAAHDLLAGYPDSPVVRKARQIEVMSAREVSEEEALRLLESYTADYPEHTEMRLMYAQMLKGRQKEKARAIFKGIYISASPFSRTAYANLADSDITPDDLIKKAANLIDAFEFKEAESVLKSALTKYNGHLKAGTRNEILKNLGISLFRQKKYKEAAKTFESLRDKYWQARSLYRDNQKDAFSDIVGSMVKGGDNRAATLLLASASDKKRDGKTEEAISIYRHVLEKYPGEREEALWGLGWLYYLRGDYSKASEILRKLHDIYGGSKYLYWSARCAEALGEDAAPVYRSLISKNRDFYNVYSNIKLGEAKQALISDKIMPSKKNSRIEALLDLGMQDMAAAELVYLAKKAPSLEDLIYINSKLHELGDYKRVLSIMKKMPYREEWHSFWYPLAYWDIVQDASSRFDTDPLIILSVMREESSFDPEAKSNAGAIGLMQIMPDTANKLDSRLKLNINNISQLYNIRNNVSLGTYYFSSLVQEFASYPHALAAYNAGENIVRQWLQRGGYKSTDEFIEDIPYNETRNYVKRILTTFFEYRRYFSSDREPPLKTGLLTGNSKILLRHDMNTLK